tara:strand:+ start:847 stop:1230 length:384 start_codon:yes stop_codon:yes gene_type:complete
MTINKPKIKITVERGYNEYDPILTIEYINPPPHWRKKVMSKKFGEFEIGTCNDIQWVGDYKFFTIGNSKKGSNTSQKTLNRHHIDRIKKDDQSEKEAIETYCQKLTDSLTEWKQDQDLRHEKTNIFD